MSADPAGDIALDLAALGRALRRHGIDVEGPLRAPRVGLGQSNLTYLIEDAAGSRWIARRPPRGQLLASAHDVAREARILSALADTSVPVPVVHAVIEDAAVCDAVVVVMEHVDGLVIDQVDVAAGLPAEVRTEISRAVPRSMARVHAVDLERHELAGLASHAPYAARQLRRWSRQWEQSRTRDLPVLDRLTEILGRAVPAQRGVSLVHGDLHLRNIICEPRTGAIRALLDWELSTLGDPLADVGTMLAYWVEAGDDPLGMFDATKLPGFLDRSAVLGEYCEATGADAGDVQYWHALGLWKIAIIIEGVCRRARDEPADASADGMPDPAAVGLLAHRALEVLTSAGVRT